MSSPAVIASDDVLTGVDVLQRNAFAPLQDRRVGLITNHTGLNREGVATIDLLRGAQGVALTALFSPEHGLRGALDAPVRDGKDRKTGLPVYSLYGTRTKPSATQLAGLDTLVYDIQDIGTRFYTYISTLGLCLETAAQHRLRFVVLDRPNPLGGRDVEGPLADRDALSFTAFHPIPIRHGLTVGELARLFAHEKGLDVDLQIVAAQGWHRADLWDATNLVWVNPSPNMRSLTEALLYPGVGLLESTNLSVGRGTDTPFEVIGAPWLDGRRLAAALNALEPPGARFIPIRFTPNASVYADRLCGGVNCVIVTRHRFVPVYTGMLIAETLRRLYPQDWEAASLGKLLANRAALNAFLAGASARKLTRSWQKDIEAFRTRCHPHLVYT